MEKLLGKAIKNLRKGIHLKVYELAARVDVQPEFITQIEKGRRLPSETVLEKLSRVLKMDLKPYYYSDKHPEIVPYLKPDIVAKLKDGRTLYVEVSTRGDADKVKQLKKYKMFATRKQSLTK